MTANDAPDEAPMAKVVKSTLLPIALASGVDKSQSARLTGMVGAGLRAIEEPRLERDGNVLREADAHEASRRDSLARADKAHCVGRRDCLAYGLRAQRREALMGLTVHNPRPRKM